MCVKYSERSQVAPPKHQESELTGRSVSRCTCRRSYASTSSPSSGLHVSSSLDSKLSPLSTTTVFLVRFLCGAFGVTEMCTLALITFGATEMCTLVLAVFLRFWPTCTLPSSGLGPSSSLDMIPAAALAFLEGFIVRRCPLGTSSPSASAVLRGFVTSGVGLVDHQLMMRHNCKDRTYQVSLALLWICLLQEGLVYHHHRNHTK